MCDPTHERPWQRAALIDDAVDHISVAEALVVVTSLVVFLPWTTASRLPKEMAADIFVAGRPETQVT